VGSLGTASVGGHHDTKTDHDHLDSPCVHYRNYLAVPDSGKPSVKGIVINTIGSILGAILFIWMFSGCQGTGSAPKLQSHLASAQTSTSQTDAKIRSTRSHLDRIDYKSSRALDLLNKGVER